MICLIEDTPFLRLILKMSVKNFRPTLGAYLIRDFSGDHNRKLKCIVHFLTVFRDCSVVQSHFATNVVMDDYKQVWTNQAIENTLRNER